MRRAAISSEKRSSASRSAVRRRPALWRHRCYTTTGAPDPTCKPKDIANPYWDSPAYSLYDPGAAYLPYSTFPGPVGSGVNAYNYPYVGTLLLNYKHDRLSITPSLQFQAGNRYGAPLTTNGIDPTQGCGALAGGSVAGDPRYPYGASGGRPFDATTCASIAGVSIPDPYTGQFDGVGAFREPAQLLGNLRVNYDVNPKRHGHADADQPAADVLRRTANEVHVPQRQQRLSVRRSRRRPEHAAGRQRV